MLNILPCELLLLILLVALSIVMDGELTTLHVEVMNRINTHYLLLIITMVSYNTAS